MKLLKNIQHKVKKVFNKLKKFTKFTIDSLVLLDNVILFELKKFRTPLKTFYMDVFSLIGSAGFIWTIPAFLMLRKKSTRFDGFLVLFGIATDVLINDFVTKYFFHRKRPNTLYPDEYSVTSLPFGYSFPSGHAMTSATAATIYALLSPKSLIFSLPILSSILFSRIYLFAHYPSDIYVGALSGILSGYIVKKSSDKLKKLLKPFKPVAKKLLSPILF